MMLEMIKVALNFGSKNIHVGRLITQQKRIYFEYDRLFIDLNLAISPFHLPLKVGTQTFAPFLFEGLPGVFNDSLPDGWGRLLFDRLMRARGINPIDLTPLDRLAHVGHFGMGALVYEPDQSEQHAQKQPLNLDMLAQQAHAVLDGSPVMVLDELLALNGSSAGARPKALIGVSQDKKNIVHGVMDLTAEYQHWLVKFANSSDGSDCGAVEYVYSRIAQLAGIEMPATFLFAATGSAGYFAVQRFDRIGNKRLHVHTACGLLHSDFRIPALDYEDLLKLTLILTKDMREVEKMFRLAVFNVLAHNRDDHAKNFSFLMDAKGNWTLSPAYDLTFSSGPNGEQSTSVMGEGRQPNDTLLYKLAGTASIDQHKAQKIILQCRDALQQWNKLALEFGVSRERVNEIGRCICR